MSKFTTLFSISFMLVLLVITPVKSIHAQEQDINKLNDFSINLTDFSKTRLNALTTKSPEINVSPLVNDVIFNEITNKGVLNNRVLSTLTWVGAGSGGLGTDFNSAANWSPAAVPGPLDDCIMNPTSAAIVTLSADITINSLSITYSNSSGGVQLWNLYTQNFALTINGNFNANNTSTGGGTKQLVFRVGATSGSTTGALIVRGNANIGTSGNEQVFLTGFTGSISRYEFQGDVTFGPQGVTASSNFPFRYVFTKTSGIQTLTINNPGVGFSAVEIGNQTTSIPTLTLAGSSNAFFNTSANRNYLIIYNSSTLDMSTKTLNVNSITGRDTLYLDNSSTIKVGGITGGISGSNFPAGFRGYYVYPNSTVNFNSAIGAQTQNITGFFYNLTIDNSSGVTLGGAASINSELFLSKGVYTNGTNLTIANGKTITRDIGSLSAAPTFTTSVNVNYTGSTSVTSGFELPSASTVLNNLTINKSGGVNLNANRTVNGTLTFTSGNISTSSNTLTLGSAGNVSGETSSHYLIGRLTTTRNVGTGSSAFGDMGVNINSGSENVGNVTVLRISGSAGIITFGTNSGIARSWYINSDSDPSSIGRIITLSWVSADDNSRDMTQAQIWRQAVTPGYYTYSTNQNVSLNDPRSISSNITNNLNNSIWTVSDPSQPLPVELLSFDAAINGRDAILSWVTAYEINNKGFNIERCSFEKTQYNDWKTVGFINGNGTTNEHQFYSYLDKNLGVSKYRYRLKQIDYNGNSEYFILNNPSELVVGKPIAFEVSQNYPNPSNPSSKIDYQIPIDGKVSLKLYNMLGQEVANLVNEQKEAGFYTAIFDGSNVSSGIYFYRLVIKGNNESFDKTMKMVVLK